MAHDVFISHASEDRATADAACAALEAAGLRCWVAPRDIMPGSDWGAAIVAAITNSKLFVLIFSSSANASPHVTREVERALAHDVPIVPVRIEDVPPGPSLEYFLNTPHWLDAFTPPLGPHLVYLVDVATRIAAGQPPPSPGAAPAGPRRSHRRWWLIVGALAAAAVIVGGAAIGWTLLPRGPAADPQCLVDVPSAPNPAICQALLDHNAGWQGCSARFALGDNAARLAQAQQMLAAGRTGADLYRAAPEFRDYGAISHYWEMFGQCVNEGDLKFDDVASGVDFPQEFWDRSRPLRRAIGGAWGGQGQPLPDFMSNFQALCQKYQAARAAAHPGAAALNCAP